MLLNNKSPYRRNFIISVLLTALFLFLQRENYWRPYIYTGQDSIGSAYAHGCAIANELGLKKNPFMIHDIDFVNHQLHEYTHWPNGHFFFLFLFIKIFGNTELTGRSYAVMLNLFAAFLLAFAFRDKKGFVFYSMPFLLLTPIARDSIPYVFIEPSFHFWIGFTAFSVSFSEAPEKRKLSAVLFRIACITAPFFAHLILPFLLFGAVTRYLFHKDKKALAADIALIAAAFAAMFLALAWTEKGLSYGLKDLFLHFLHRSNLSIRFHEEAPVSMVMLADTIIYKLKHNLLVFWYLLPLAWLYCLLKRKSVSFLLPAAAVNILLMSNYVYPHVFAQYNFIWLSLVTAFFLASYLLEHLSDAGAAFFHAEKNQGGQKENTIITAAVLTTVFIFSCYEVRTNSTSYQIDPVFVNFHNTFTSLKNEIEHSECNCFDRISVQNGQLVKYEGRTISLYAQFFLAEKVLRSIKRNEPKQCGGINFEEHTLLCHENGLQSLPAENFTP
ncbi:MAG TPA: hypothetical protein VNJ07_11645 [Chitinophagales bacterium]|nr:hypothetical protein [Chitinophagales bacterium]